MEISLDYEDELDAAREAVRHAGGAKKVGPQMFPDKSVESAARYLMDALNPARAERLTPSQVLMLMRLAREAGFHGFATWWMRQAGYQAPVPIAPVSEAAVLTAQISILVTRLEELLHPAVRLQEANQAPGTQGGVA